MTPTNPSSPIEQTDKVLKQFLKDSDGTVENPRGEALARISAIVVESLPPKDPMTGFPKIDQQTVGWNQAIDEIKAKWSNQGEK